MQQAQNLGSAMQFDLTETERTFLLKRLDELRHKSYRNNLEEALLHKIEPFIEVLAVLTNRYEAIAANPPYMGSSNMNGELKEYINKHYPDAKSDLMTVFMELAYELVKKNGQVGMINLPSWMFLSSFEKLRKKLVESVLFTSLIQHGRGIFGSDFGSVSFCFSKENPDGKKGIYRRLFREHVKVDSVEEKERRFLDKSYGYFISEQTNFSKIPGSPIAYWISENMISNFLSNKLEKYAHSFQGLITGDNGKLLRFWHEIENSSIHYTLSKYDDSKGICCWVPYHKGGDFRRWYGNKEYILYWNGIGVNLQPKVNW
jgi:type I restriction-modification system DNA methylase subunit